jgi:hypothetical protein
MKKSFYKQFEVFLDLTALKIENIQKFELKIWNVMNLGKVWAISLYADIV